MNKLLLKLFVVILIIGCNSSEKKTNSLELNISEEKKDPKLEISMTRGKAIYTDFCVTCHMPNGKGVPKAFPPLANSDYLMNNRAASIKSIKYGQSGEIKVNGQIYNGVMAPLGLEDEEIADVMNYITNSWGNSNNKLITAQEVSQIEQ